jgi:hypothetical protein
MQDAPIGVGKTPFAISYSVSHPVSYELSDGLPADALRDVSESEFTATWGNRGTTFERSSPVSSLDPARVTPYSQTFNLTVQRQWRGILFEAGYLGNLGHHVQMNIGSLNRIPEELLSRTDIPMRLRRPWTIFAGDQSSVSFAQTNWGNLAHHAFAFKSEMRYRNGFSWILSYAHTKSIDNSSFIGGTQLGDNDGVQNVRNLRGERTLSTNSIAHRVVFAPIVELPFGKGRRWLNQGGVVSAVLGGWQLSTIGTMQSGLPFGVNVLNGGRDVLGDPSGTLRPDLLGDPNSSNQGEPASGVRGLQWIDAGGFGVPAPYIYGNVARTIPGVTGPGLVNFDAMVAKNFRIGERWRAQLRWEMFNTFNTPQFDLPGQNVGGGDFGIVTAAAGRRIMQFGLKLYW